MVRRFDFDRKAQRQRDKRIQLHCAAFPPLTASLIIVFSHFRVPESFFFQHSILCICLLRGFHPFSCPSPLGMVLVFDGMILTRMISGRTGPFANQPFRSVSAPYGRWTYQAQHDSDSEKERRFKGTRCSADWVLGQSQHHPLPSCFRFSVL